jgi:hypothetical protein
MSNRGSASDTIEIPMMQVTDLYNKRQSRDKSRLKAYNQMLETIYHRVRVTSQLPTGQTYLLYNIPPFILGLPRIDLQDCVVYLVYQLRASEFEVKYTYPNFLYISWGHHEKQYLVNDSPILQAMMATKAAAEEAARQATRSATTGVAERGGAGSVKGRKPKVSFSDDASAGAAAGRAQPAYGLGNQRPPRRDINDYQPPASFYNSIERPTQQAGAALGALWGSGSGTGGR